MTVQQSEPPGSLLCRGPRVSAIDQDLGAHLPRQVAKVRARVFGELHEALGFIKLSLRTQYGSEQAFGLRQPPTALAHRLEGCHRLTQHRFRAVETARD